LLQLEDFAARVQTTKPAKTHAGETLFKLLE